MSDYYNYTNEDPFSDYEDDFSDYIPSTIRPGFWLAVAVILYSTSSVLVLPFKIVYDNRRYDITNMIALSFLLTLI
jgi:hypothetical protein